MKSLSDHGRKLYTSFDYSDPNKHYYFVSARKQWIAERGAGENEERCLRFR